MEKDNYGQLELFTADGVAAQAPERFSKVVLKRIKAFEKAIILVLLLGITGIICYAFGFDKGKSSNQVSSKFLIQVAAYSVKANAEEEARFLNKYGYQTAMLKQKGKTILLVVGFSSEEKARVALTRLQKRYKGCILRRL